MTNEELATRIKAGERGLLPQLWNQVRKLVEIWATRYRTCESRFSFVDRQDFVQCGYMAMEDAIQAFDPCKPFKFNSYLGNCYKGQIDKMLGIRRVKQKDGGRKRIYSDNTTSLDRPITHDSDSDEYMHFFFDSSVAIDRDYEQNELRFMLSDAIARLWEQGQTVIIAIYYMDAKRADLARRLNLSKKQLERIEQKALKQMRKDTALRDLYFSAYYVPAASTYKGGTFETMAISSQLEGLMNGF